MRLPRIMHSMRPPSSLSSPLSLSLSPSSPLLSPFPSSSSSLLLRPRRLRPLSSLRETKKATLRKASNVPRTSGSTTARGAARAPDQINAFLTQFSDFIEGYGPAGYALFVLVYAGLEILAIPAIPLTMSAGLLFGSVTGTIIVSISGTMAAAVAFLIARYFARERILKLVEGNKKFLAIDKAIGENGFWVVTLLRLSPLLPFSLGNYLYGLTSVKFLPYVLGSWLGMLPGTWAYVSAGAFGRALIQEESDVGLPGGNGQLLTLGLGLLFTAVAATYVTRLAKDAIKDIE
uniref:VTT domain-containing protein n=1 Tax=Ananas comosus var. bracteatus TaxID=296719 RepID=A0A6V7NI40_ANACO|nr:unnamed protein product [Ananas comosus var. bracteatus]